MPKEVHMSLTVHRPHMIHVPLLIISEVACSRDWYRYPPFMNGQQPQPSACVLQ